MINVFKLNVNEVDNEGTPEGLFYIGNTSYFVDKYLVLDKGTEKTITRKEVLNYNGYYVITLNNFKDDKNEKNMILIKDLSNIYEFGLSLYNNLLDKLTKEMEEHILESIDNKALKSIKKQIADIIHYKVLWKIKYKIGE